MAGTGRKLTDPHYITLVAVCCAMIAGGLWIDRDALTSMGWRSVEGRILPAAADSVADSLVPARPVSAVDSIAGGEDARRPGVVDAQPSFRYGYEVEGKQYEGIGAYDGGSPPADVRQWSEPDADNVPVRVYYDPRDPARSVLSRPPHSTPGLALAFAGLMGLIGVTVLFLL
jgi:hypothetical protein